MLSLLLKNLTSIWREPLCQTGIALQQPLSAIQLGGATGKDRKVNYLIFSADRARPTLLIKIARTASYQERLLHEHQALVTIWQTSTLQSSVPKPVGLFEVDNNLFLLEQCLPGTSLKVLLRRRQRIKPVQVQQDCRQSITWLHNMQQVTCSGTETFNGEMAVNQRLKRLTITLPTSFIKNLKALALQYAGLNIPISHHHGDYWPGNLLLNKGGLGVIDWEDFQPNAWPFHDFFHFFINYAHTYPWQDWHWLAAKITFRQTLIEQNWFTNLFEDFTRQYFQSLNIPFQAAHLFLSLFLMDQAAPKATAGQKRQQQAAVWQDRLLLYANYEHNSLFNRSRI